MKTPDYTSNLRSCSHVKDSILERASPRTSQDLGRRESIEFLRILAPGPDMRNTTRDVVSYDLTGPKI